MKKSKEELLNDINALEIDEDLKITLMEDITDSLVDNSEEYEKFKDEYEQEKANLEAQIANEKAYITELKNKYKERFLSPIDDKEDEPNGLDEIEIVEKSDILEEV